MSTDKKFICPDCGGREMAISQNIGYRQIDMLTVEMHYVTDARCRRCHRPLPEFSNDYRKIVPINPTEREP